VSRLCIETRSEVCGRAGLQNAYAHAADRAAALSTRQRVTVQGHGQWLYFVIRSTDRPAPAR
jgi:hypothetical protein